ncbi:hypothetical protein IMZ48_39295 [Candidatus Bathyarchaeota archaeon]|nr:hypothetical protein [Candidatus Bathyarchaeota archaeon]
MASAKDCAIFPPPEKRVQDGNIWGWVYFRPVRRLRPATAAGVDHMTHNTKRRLEQHTH